MELFSGAGGGILGSLLCGQTCIGAVEYEEYPRKVLLQRQRDGLLPQFPIWDDVRTFRLDNPETKEYIEFLRTIREDLTISGGFPCQDISAAGTGSGITKDSRSGLWFEFARIVDEIRPSRVSVENSPVLTSRGLGIVLGDLAKMGYDAKWGVLGAVDVGAPHKRERIWISATLADTMCNGLQGIWKDRSIKRSSGLCSGARGDKKQSLLSNSGHNGNVERIGELREDQSASQTRPCNRSREKVNEVGKWWEVEPELGRVVDGMASRVDRLKAIGNGQVPEVARTAWEILKCN